MSQAQFDGSTPPPDPVGLPSHCRDVAAEERGEGFARRAADRAQHPFIWQDGARLLLLVREPEAWTLAELEFLAPECRYHERCRVSYTWPREAAGAMMARAVTFDLPARGQLATRLEHWMLTELSSRS